MILNIMQMTVLQKKLQQTQFEHNMVILPQHVTTNNGHLRSHDCCLKPLGIQTAVCIIYCMLFLNMLISYIREDYHETPTM